MAELARKPNAEKISAQLAALTSEPWLTTKWWPRFLYHFAELRNAISILEDGELKSRDAKAMKVDTASPKIIGHTASQWTKYARLYFRPRTPTQYQCEGFRPADQYGTLGAHCPMPFVFVFDADDLLTRESTKFSDGNLSANPNVGDTAEFFCALPFAGIYHASPLSPDVKAKIVHQRCSEVLVPGGLDLGALKKVWCRSPAEYQTLFNRLSNSARRRFQSKIGHGAQLEMHFRKWTYLESAILEHQRITFRFNPSSQAPGPFAAAMTITSPYYGIREWAEEGYNATKQPQLAFNLSEFEDDVEYDVHLTLDGNSAYFGQYRPSQSGGGSMVR